MIYIINNYYKFSKCDKFCISGETTSTLLLVRSLYYIF